MRRICYGLVILALLLVAGDGFAQTTSLFNGGYIVDKACTTCAARIDHYNAVAIQPHTSGALRAWRVDACGTTAQTVVNSNPDRRDLYIQNMGGPRVSPLAGGGGNHSNAAIGYTTTGHVTLTMNNGWILHSMTFAVGQAATAPGPGLGGPTTQLILENYQGPISCIAATTGPLGATLGILEILR